MKNFNKNTIFTKDQETITNSKYKGNIIKQLGSYTKPWSGIYSILKLLENRIGELIVVNA